MIAIMPFLNQLFAHGQTEAPDPAHVTSGHGPATTLVRAHVDTRDYLMNLRALVREHMNARGDIIGSVKVDQSAFSRLGQFEALAGRKAQAVFQQMEWE